MHPHYDICSDNLVNPILGQPEVYSLSKTVKCDHCNKTGNNRGPHPVYCYYLAYARGRARHNVR